MVLVDDWLDITDPWGERVLVMAPGKLAQNRTNGRYCWVLGYTLTPTGTTYLVRYADLSEAQLDDWHLIPA